MNLSLRSIKEKSLKFYKQQLEDVKNNTNASTLSYLNAAIEILEIDINGTETNDMNSVKTPSPEVLRQLKSIGLSANKSLLFGFLLVNKKIVVSKIFKSTGLPRTETYHIVNELRVMGLIHVIPSVPKVIVLAVPENPLQPVIDSKAKELSEIKLKVKQFEPTVNTK